MCKTWSMKKSTLAMMSQKNKDLLKTNVRRVLRPRTNAREYRRKVRESVIKGDTPRPKAPTPPWFPRLERWETVGGHQTRCRTPRHGRS
eukprot:2819500-Amphidinium_carterae.3